METLAYLHLAEDYENSEVKELNLQGLKKATIVGLVGAAAVVGGVVGTADSASAYGYHGCGRHCYRSYQPRYYSYHYYRPVHRYHYYNPCY
jgi:hypothetical protein